MNPFRPISLTSTFVALLLVQTPVFAVDYYQQQLQNEQLLKRQIALQKSMEFARYQRQVGDKALNGITNMVTGPLELPKNVINVYNNNISSYDNFTNNAAYSQSDGNLVYGVIGGVIKGALDSTARIMVGFGDVITAPLPTKPVVYPRYIWDDFDRSNSYGQVFRLVDNPPIEPYIAPPPRPAVVQAPIQDQTEQYSQETNRNLDTMFRKEMMK